MRHGYHTKKVFLIPNFIDRQSMLSQAAEGNVAAARLSAGVLPTERVIIGVGRLTAAKRFDVFMRTLYDCARTDPHTSILGIILGDGPERQHLQEIIDQLDLPNLRLKLLGFQSDVATYVTMADIFLFPSEHLEVLPMCLIEATALGVPVVCSDIPGNNDIVEHARNGFLVDVQKKDYSAFVLQLLQDEFLRKQFGLYGMAKAEKCYDKNTVVVDIDAVYKSLGNI
jgi:glycosyltransferase involved in cell wall biosynthesis